MEDEQVKSMKSVARRGALISAAAVSTVTLAACSAGQITQTSSQVAAVDGTQADTENGTIALRDVTVHLTDKGEAGVKFTAVNQDNSNARHTLKSITVGGEKAVITGETTINSDCSLVGDVPSELTKLTKPKNICIEHVSTTIANTGLAVGGNKEVVFTFDSGTITTTATISTPVVESGTQDREVGAHNAH
ncbi:MULTISPECIES: hypothetical protein [Corynebacterium]|uniref:hypothetical protein n=1 Tax=Corynebacterium TaxID=1716 RepID=UPI0004CE0B4B|nr:MULTISPECIES: hypothetical protein [Corynebacterium]